MAAVTYEMIPCKVCPVKWPVPSVSAKLIELKWRLQMISTGEHTWARVWLEWYNSAQNDRFLKPDLQSIFAIFLPFKRRVALLICFFENRRMALDRFFNLAHSLVYGTNKLWSYADLFLDYSIIPSSGASSVTTPEEYGRKSTGDIALPIRGLSLLAYCEMWMCVHYVSEDMVYFDINGRKALLIIL